jgi:hypothetical protein
MLPKATTGPKQKQNYKYGKGRHICGAALDLRRVYGMLEKFHKNANMAGKR